MTAESVTRSHNAARAVTRVSIHLHESLAEWMDGRVKPGHDEKREFPLKAP
jgi:hypothetical protein